MKPNAKRLTNCFMNSGLRIYRSRLGESFFLLTGLCRIHYTVWHCPSHVSKWTTFDFLTGKLKSSKSYTESNGIGVSPTVSKPSSFSVVVCLPIKSPKHCLSTQRPSAIGSAAYKNGGTNELLTLYYEGKAPSISEQQQAERELRLNRQRS